MNNRNQPLMKIKTDSDKRGRTHRPEHDAEDKPPVEPHGGNGGRRVSRKVPQAMGRTQQHGKEEGLQYL